MREIQHGDDKDATSTSKTKTTKTKIKTNNKSAVEPTTSKTEQTTTSSNNQNASNLTSSTILETKECAEQSNKTSKPKTKLNNDAQITGIDRTEHETNESIEENCTEITTTPAKASLKTSFATQLKEMETAILE